MFCKNCGKEINDSAVICPFCGIATENFQRKEVALDDSGSVGWWFLGFFFPLIGLILYCVWRNEKPLKASRCLKGFITSLVLSLIVGGIYLILLSSVLNLYY